MNERMAEQRTAFGGGSSQTDPTIDDMEDLDEGPMDVDSGRETLSGTTQDATESSVAAPVPVIESTRSTEAIDPLRGLTGAGDQQADEMVPERLVESQRQENTRGTRMQRSSSAQTRSQPCGMCGPCKRKNCGICENCRGMSEFGGKGKRKQRCIHRKCINPIRALDASQKILTDMFRPSRSPSTTEEYSSSKDPPDSQNTRDTLQDTQETPDSETEDNQTENVLSMETQEQQAAPQQPLVPERIPSRVRALLENALHEGHIRTRITKCVANGPPGVGKTCLIHFLLGKPRPKVRNSTPILDQTEKMAINLPRRVDCTKVCSDGTPDNWTCLSIEEQELMLAESICHCAETAGTDKHSGVDSSATECTPSSSTPETGAVTSSLATCDRILENLKTCKPTSRISDMHLVHLMDTGGQPQFLELLPAFVRNTSVNLVVFKLCDKLEDHAMFEYAVKGKLFQRDKRDRLDVTNEQMIEQTARALLSCKYSSSVGERPGLQQVKVHEYASHPKMMLIGTFKDQVSRCRETPEEKENILKKNENLRSAIDQEDILIENQEENFIFQIDGSEKGWDSNTEVIAEIRRCILEKTHCLEADIPTRWYLLELELMKAAKESGEWCILSIDVCFEIGEKLRMTQEETEGALLYFNELNIILYYSEVESLRKTVFCDPQLLVKKISDLIVASFRGSKSLYPTMPRSAREKLHNSGEFKSSIFKLECFASGFHPTLFTSEHFVDLLEHLNIIAKIEERAGISTYFIPCVLPRVRVNENQRRSKWAPQSDTVEPLLIYFPGGWSPQGLFCALIVSLTSQSKNNPLLVAKDKQKFSPSRNLIEFKLRGRGTIIIVDALKWFEIHTTCDPEDCPGIRRRIRENIDEVLPKFFYDKDKVQYKDGFFCKFVDCNHKQLHAATVAFDDDGRPSSLTCSGSERTWTKDFTNKQLVWFSSEQSDGISPPPSKRPRLDRHAEVATSSQAIEMHLSKDDLRFLLEILGGIASEWKTLGLHLCISVDELNIIESKPLCIPEGPKAFLREMLTKWLERAHPYPTVAAMVDALRKSGKERLANVFPQRIAQAGGEDVASRRNQ